MPINPRFTYAANINIGRSKFDRSFSHKTTINTGDLVPIYWDEVYPGDSVSLSVKALVRSLAVQAPVMDNSYLTIEAYFVPNRVIWNHWVNFLGENDQSAWTESTEYTVPTWAIDNTSVSVGDVGDYLGLPAGVKRGDYFGVSELPLRAYCKIWNDFWRDENYQEPVLFSVTDNPTSNVVYSYHEPCLKANKFHDYFTSVLPAPQKGDAVSVGLGESAPITGSAVLSGSFSTGASASNYPIEIENPNFVFDGVQFARDPGQTTAMADLVVAKNGVSTMAYNAGSGTVPDFKKLSAITAPRFSMDGVPLSSSDVSLTGLKADLSNATAVSINDLRLAFQVQKYLETNARFGTKYYEFLAGHFGVTTPDAVLQNAQYLGGKRIPLNMETVVANSSSEGGSTLGDMAGYSKTFGDSGRVLQSFTEFGILMVVATIRTDHTYSQGIPRKFTRKTRYDYYDPKFANLGEQAVMATEINYKAPEDAVFGYQEAYADLRYNPNVLSGLMAPAVSGSLSMWTYGDDFDESLDVASADFMEETKANVDRTLAVKSNFQWLADFYFDCQWVRPMPVYSVPGLIDHH